MNKVKPILAIILLLLAYVAIPQSGFSQEKSDDAAAKQDDKSGERKADAKEADEAASEEPEIVPLTIGSPAPKLDIEHWVQDGGGHFAKVSEFESGKVYVVEFWATWCGPCIASMPHIAELQKAYADRGVQVVSITREDVATVEKFLDREVRGVRKQKDDDEDEDDEDDDDGDDDDDDDGDDDDDDEDDDKPITYRDLTSVYCLTADPDGSTSRDYMQAAAQNGIPCAFIVGKDAKIEWIGHPMTMDKPLEQIVTDSWDRDAFAEEFNAEQEVDMVLAQVSRKMRAKRTKEAVAILDDYIANGKLDSQKSRFGMIKFQVLISDKEFADEAAQYAIGLLDDDTRDANGVNQITWTIYQMAKAGRLDNDDLVQAALDASSKAVEDAGMYKPYLLDTVSHLNHQLGNLDAALEAQRAAMKAADPGIRARLQPFLKQLQREIAAEEKPEADEQPEEADEK